MRIIVPYFIYVGDLVSDVVVLVGTESGLVNEEIGYLLSVQYCYSGLIEVALALVIEGELNLVNSVSNSEPWVDHTFNNCNILFIC